MGSSLKNDEQDDIIAELEVVETDPTGRYVRYDEILGEGAFKTVYKGFDEVNGLEIAWSKVELPEKVFKSEKSLRSVCSEANLLKSLKHDNIMRCFHSWVDYEKKTVNMITELFTSGNMSQYRKKHSLVDRKAIKNWCRQILRGLEYLHCHNPPIIHRDLKCDNIFVNGNSGKVKIGDLGLATVIQQGCERRASGGTPEFMAPELFDDDYDQLVDIYSFGMCLLQMVTRELPYSECTNSGQIYRKICCGIKPAALSKVTDPQVKQLIEKCLGPASERPSATEILNDPFLAPSSSSDSGSSAASSIMSFRSESLCSSTFSSPVLLDQAKNYWSPVAAAAPDDEAVKSTVKEKNTFKLQGNKLEDKESVSMILRIVESASHAKKIEFEFFPQTDTVFSVMEEMAKELELSARDATLITELMEEVVAELNVCRVKEVRDSVPTSSSPEIEVVSQQIKPAESPCVEKPRVQQPEPAPETRKAYNPAGSTPLLDNVKAKDLNGSADCHSSIWGLFNQRLSSKYQIRKQVTKVVRRNSKECSKQVARARFRSLRKLLFFCGNKF